MSRLNPTNIAAAGLDVIAEGGPDALTMRAVALKLDVSPMALYSHVANKRALVALLVETVFQNRPLPVPTGDWSADLWNLAVSIRETVLTHPEILRLRREHEVWTPSVLAVGEHWINLWRNSGLDIESAKHAALTSYVALLGAMEFETSDPNVRGPDAQDLLLLPNMRSIFEDRPASIFETTMRSIIDGLHARHRDGAPV